MSRISLRDPEALPAAFQDLYAAEGEHMPQVLPLLQAYADVPELLLPFMSWYGAWHMSDPSVPSCVPTRVKELIRLRLATFNGCRMCKSARMSPDTVAEAEAGGIDDTTVAEGLAPDESAALAFAEKMALDHYSIDDDDFDSLRRHFDQAQILELITLIGVIYIGHGRVLSILQLDEVSCPVPSAAPGWQVPETAEPGLVAQRAFVEAAKAAAPA
jgi:alkylhydroperoxidase family enzyme